MLKYLQTTRNSPSSSPETSVRQTRQPTNSNRTSVYSSPEKRRQIKRHSSLVRSNPEAQAERSWRRHTLRGNRRRLSLRAKSSYIQPEDTELPRDMRKFVQTKSSRPFCNWSTDDLCEWLRVNALDRDDMLAIQFRSSQLNGGQLVVPETAWELMGRYTFKDDQHKKEVLLKLAECIREAREEKRSLRTSPKHQAQRFLQVPSPLSYSRESVASSSDCVSNSSRSSALPSNSSDQELTNVDTASKASSSSSQRNSKMMKVISNLKGSVAKLRPSSSDEDILMANHLQPITIYTELEIPGQLTPTELQVTQTTTTTELIQLFLDGSSQVEDINLFLLSEVTLPSGDEKDLKNKPPELSRRLLENSESPLVVFKSLSSAKRNTVRRLELVKGKGIAINVTCRISTHKLRAKQFRVSLLSSVDHVIKVALCKFRLFNVDPALFALCEVSMSGDITELEKSNKRKWQSGLSFVLCDRPSLESRKKEPLSAHRFFRSISSVSQASQKSDASSNDSWIPLKLDKKGLLNGEIKKSPDLPNSSIFRSDNGDLTVNEIPPLNDDSTGNWSQRRKDVNSLSIENAILRAQIQEQDEQMEEIRAKVADVRRVLENGLHQYHDDALYKDDSSLKLNSMAFENNLKSTEKLITDSEDMLGQLFCHQRQLLSRKKQDSPTRSRDKLDACTDDDIADAGGETEIELRIASHQADLLALKHRYYVTDMKMSLFVANRKAEKFRHMITGSLYDVIADRNSNIRYTNTHFSSDFHFTLHSCEILPDGAGYGLAMRDEKESRNNGCAKMKGTVLECDHQQGRLFKGDRLIEVNGVNVQTCGATFVERILKETSSARIVVLRKSTVEENGFPEEMLPDHVIIPSPVEEKSDAMRKHFADEQFLSENGPVPDWREMSALQSDLSMLMRELELTSRAKRDLERDLALRKNHDMKLESENARLKRQIEELTRRRQPSVDYVSC